MAKEYIEREALKEAFEEDGHLSAYIEEMIDDSPAADVVEVRHGRWESSRPDAPMFGFHFCSICGRKRTSPQDNYCPSCGAKMEVEHETD